MRPVHRGMGQVCYPANGIGKVPESWCGCAARNCRDRPPGAHRGY